MEDVQKILDTIPTAHLIGELLDRCTPAIFIGRKVEEIDHCSENISWFHSCGNDHVCRGLCQEMDSVLMEKIVKNAVKEVQDNE